jgi:3-(3-hydroxy-phenyl)propionate hydroxylase
MQALPPSGLLRLLAVGGETALPTLADPDGRLARHLQTTAGSLCLIRPDAYLAATLHNFEPTQLNAALRAALADSCNPSPVP